MTKKVLGRGLGALISEDARKRYSKENQKESIEQIATAEIAPNRYQPRKEFTREALAELTSSIKEKGVVQPVLVRTRGDSYELIAGERRLRAVRALGYERIPAVVKDVDDKGALELSLIENIQREELNPMEEAYAYQTLIDEFSFTQDMIGQAVGKDRSTIANSIRLIGLPAQVREFISKNLLSIGHAKVILSVEGAAAQVDFSTRAVKKGLSVKALENLIKRAKPSKRRKAPVDANMRLVEERLQEILGTKVRITRKKKGGTIEAEFYSDEDLGRILKILKCEL